MQLEEDIIERIRADFPPHEAERVIALISDARRRGRVARCIVVASSGSIDRLERWVRSSRKDYRDVIAAGEDERGGGLSARRLRDLRVSFLIDGPEKLWIGEVACLMHARGYALSRVEPRCASAGPVEYENDRHEGVAQFTGPLGTFEVERRDRRWTIRGNIDARRWEHLVRPYDDEQAFRDALSGYLLVSQRDP